MKSKLVALVLLMATVCFGQIAFTSKTRGGGGTPALVTGQVCGAQTNSMTVTCSLPANATTANFIGVWGSINTGQTITAAPTLTGASFTQVGSNCSTGGNDLYMWFAPNVTGGNKTVTYTTSGTNGNEIHVAEFSGVATSSPLDTTASANMTSNCNTGSSGATISTLASGSLAGSNELALGWFRQDTSATILASSGGYADVVNLGDNFLSNYKVVSAATTASATNSSTGFSYAATVVVFK